jgi:transcriptional regulator with XRE-family HTH domain
MEPMAPTTRSDRETAELRESLVTNIKVMQVRRRISGRNLCERLGVAHNWLSKRNNGLQPFTLDDIVAIARELDTTLGELLGIQSTELTHPVALEVEEILNDTSMPRKFKDDFLGLVGHAIAMFLYASTSRTQRRAR